jgi:hypothetical protein
MGNTRDPLLAKADILSQIKYYTGLVLTDISEEDIDEAIEMNAYFDRIGYDGSHTLDEHTNYVLHQKYLYYQTKYNLDVQID